MVDSYPSSDMDMTVTWGDSDPAGISYYARTFDWFTNGRMQFMSCYGFPYMETFHRHGIALVCLTANCDYKKMLRPSDQITVRTFLTKLTRTRLTFTYRIFKSNGELAAEGETKHTFADDYGNPFNFNKRFPQLWEQLTDKLLIP